MYKYLPPERIDVLETNSICFNNPLNFNDPFEFNACFELDSFEVRLRKDLTDTELLQHLPEEFSELIKLLPPLERDRILDEAKKNMFAIFENSKNHIKSSVSDVLLNFNSGLISITRVLSLTKSASNLLMWGHYSQSHSGFALEFNTEDAFFNQRRSNKDEFGYLREVIYQQNLPSIDPLLSPVVNHFLIKSLDWAYEQEWRILLPETKSMSHKIHDGKTYDLFHIPSSAIKSIVFGCNCSIQLRESIYNLIASRYDYKHINYYQATRSTTKYELEINEI